MANVFPSKNHKSIASQFRLSSTILLALIIASIIIIGIENAASVDCITTQSINAADTFRAYNEMMAYEFIT